MSEVNLSLDHLIKLLIKDKQDISKSVFEKKSKVRESALVPLSCNSLNGLIALGTDEIGKYDSNKDTIFLDFIAEVVSKLVDSHNA